MCEERLGTYQVISGQKIPNNFSNKGDSVNMEKAVLVKYQKCFIKTKFSSDKGERGNAIPGEKAEGEGIFYLHERYFSMGKSKWREDMKR